jgi:hypothetical protein
MVMLPVPPGIIWTLATRTFFCRFRKNKVSCSYTCFISSLIPSKARASGPCACDRRRGRRAAGQLFFALAVLAEHTFNGNRHNLLGVLFDEVAELSLFEVADIAGMGIVGFLICFITREDSLSALITITKSPQSTCGVLCGLMLAAKQPAAVTAVFPRGFPQRQGYTTCVYILFPLHESGHIYLLRCTLLTKQSRNIKIVSHLMRLNDIAHL